MITPNAHLDKDATFAIILSGDNQKLATGKLFVGVPGNYRFLLIDTPNLECLNKMQEVRAVTKTNLYRLGDWKPEGGKNPNQYRFDVLECEKLAPTTLPPSP